MASGGLTPLVMNGCGNVQCMSDAGRIGDPPETLEVDWSHSPLASRPHCTTSLNFESRGERKGERPKNTWCRHLEAYVKETGYSWTQLEMLAQDRSARFIPPEIDVVQNFKMV